jgi:hypothetical protein
VILTLPLWYTLRRDPTTWFAQKSFHRGMQARVCRAGGAIGGKGVAKAPMASEMPAMEKARASRFLENLRVF